MSSDWEQRYATSLNTLSDLRGELKALTDENQSVIYTLKTQLEEKQQVAETFEAEFQEQRRKTLSSAEHIKTAKGVSSKVCYFSFTNSR
jgi:HPt (histidine-containing phosphotransfer) domain-containing protein